MMAFDFHARPYLTELIKEDRWNVLTVLIFHSNADNRCWPSGEKIHSITGKSQTTITKAKQWLIEHGAIRLVPNAERTEKEKKLPRRQHIYQLTGMLDLNGEKIPYFFQPEIKLVDPSEDKSNPTNVEVPVSGSSSEWKFHPVETKLSPEELIPEVIPKNTDIAKAISPTGVGAVDQTIQVEHMVSSQAEVIAPTKPVLAERIEEQTPNPVPTPPSPANRRVNKHDVTVVTPHDPIFDSVAKLQFGIDDTSQMPMTTNKAGKRRSVYGARVQAIVNVIIDQYKLRNNVTALTAQEREGLASIHAKFWIWYTEVKYPPKGNDAPPQLRDGNKFAEYWLEYRAYRNAPKPEPKPTSKDWTWTEEGYKLV